jgi:FMN-dependent NADH-azoreductase
LAQAYLAKRLEAQPCNVETIVLEDLSLKPLLGDGLTQREEAIRTGDFSGEAFELARAFAAADEVVIAVPYWDMSFPSLLKLYVEQLCVNKLTFCYDETGRPRGLVKVKRVVYITTSGGYIRTANFGFDYIKCLFSTLFGITDISFISAEGLDLYGNDPEQILQDAIQKVTQC